MIGNDFSVLDASVRPRAGQPVVVDHLGQRFRATVRSFSRDCLWIAPESMLYAGRLRPGSRTQVTVVTPYGIIAATLRMIKNVDQVLTMQLVEPPAVVQRRGDPRVRAQFDISLTWFGPGTETPHRADGQTQNLSRGGALLRFSDHQQPRPPAHTPTLLAIRLPDGVLSVAVQVLQEWEGGARTRFVNVSPEAAARLADVIASYLY